jgi:hypothetical protein
MWKIDDIIGDRGVNNPWLSHLSLLPIQFVPHPRSGECASGETPPGPHLRQDDIFKGKIYHLA